MEFANGTYLAPEEHAYPNGGQTRKCRAQFPDGKVRTVYAGIPDTYFSAPAHAKMAGKYIAGWVGVNTDGATNANAYLEFHPNKA